MLAMLLIDMRVAAALQQNPNETINSPAMQKYTEEMKQQVDRFLAPSRLAATAVGLEFTHLVRYRWNPQNIKEAEQVETIPEIEVRVFQQLRFRDVREAD
jgi:hypothetical protein